MNQVVVGTHMNQEKHKNKPQVFYNDKWVDKEHFRAFVYRENEQKLAKSYKEFEDLIASGLWFDSKDKSIVAVKKRLDQIDAEIIDLKKKARKPKNGANS